MATILDHQHVVQKNFMNILVYTVELSHHPPHPSLFFIFLFLTIIALSPFKYLISLWALKPFKVLGTNGLHVDFFQIFWMNVKNSVCKKISDIFLARAILKYLNETLICLNPKCQSPKSLNNYQPISLCNSIYKLVLKIIVARIRHFLHKILPNLSCIHARKERVG